MSGQREANWQVKMRGASAAFAQKNMANNLFSPEAREAISRYPILASIPISKHVLTCARNLDALPAADRVRALDRFELQDTDVLAALAEVPPMLNRAERLIADAPLARLIGVIERPKER